MKIICFPHFYYLSEVSRLVEIGKALKSLGQDVQFFSHGGTYESIPINEGFEVVSVQPTMSQERAHEYMKYNRGEGSKSLKSSFFTYEELKEYVSHEAEAFRNARADAVLIGWNLPSYLSVQLVGIPIIVQQPGPWTAPFFERKMAEFVPAAAGHSVAKLFHLLPMDRFINWLMPRVKLWVAPFNQLASELGLPIYKSTLDLMAGDLTLVMDAPEILGIPPEEIENYVPQHPEFFHRLPKYRYGGPCYAKLPGKVSEEIQNHLNTLHTKLYCAMGVSGSPEVLQSIIEIVSDLDLQAVIATTTILDEKVTGLSEQVLIAPHVPAHLVNPLADIAITHGGAGTVQTAIHSGTPIIGVPMHLEQAGNIALVKRQGAGLMLWKQELGKRQLDSTLYQIISDEIFRKNMLRLKKIQDQIDGASKAAQVLVDFVKGKVS